MFNVAHSPSNTLYIDLPNLRRIIQCWVVERVPRQCSQRHGSFDTVSSHQSLGHNILSDTTTPEGYPRINETPLCCAVLKPNDRLVFRFSG